MTLSAPSQTALNRTRAAGRWFLGSGIQTAEGGVARYYRGDLGSNARVSTEITGYAVSALVDLNRRSSEPEYLKAAVRAADFLIDCAWDPRLGVFPFEYPNDGGQRLTYFFDTGIIVRGLLAIWRATRNDRYLRGATDGGESMARHFVDSDGSFHPILTLPACEALPRGSQWSRSPGCYQLKAAMAWHDLYRASGDPGFQELYSSAAKQALSSHESFLPGESPQKTMDRLHAYCYFLEGLLPIVNRQEAELALHTGIERTSGYLRQIRPTFERSDVYAQLLRLRLFAERLCGIPVARTLAEEEVAAIQAFQFAREEATWRGGYSFGRNAGALIPHVNPVSAAFCTQALEMWRDFKEGLPLDATSLI